MPDRSDLDQKFSSAIRPPSGSARQPAPVPCANGCLEADGTPRHADAYHPLYPYDTAHSLCAACWMRLGPGR